MHCALETRFILLPFTCWKLNRFSQFFQCWKKKEGITNEITSFLKAYLFTSGKCEWLWKKAGSVTELVAQSTVPVSLKFLSNLLMLLVVHPLSENSVLNCLTLYPFNWCNFLPTVAMQRSVIVIVCRLSSPVVCRLSVTWVYCDKTAEARITPFSLKCSQCINSSAAKFDYEIQRGPLDRGDQTGVGRFLTSRCYISETVRDRAQLTIGSHIWAFDCNKSWWPWITLNVNALLCR